MFCVNRVSGIRRWLKDQESPRIRKAEGLCPLGIFSDLGAGKIAIAKSSVKDESTVEKPIQTDMGSLASADVVKDRTELLAPGLI